MTTIKSTIKKVMTVPSTIEKVMTLDNNDYNVINNADFLYRNNGGSVETFADWKTDTGMDASSTF